MKKIAALLVALLLANSAFAADNIAITQGSGTTIKTKDVGAGVEESQVLLSDAAGLSILGIAGTANSNVITIQGIASMTPLGVSAASGALAAGAGADGWDITEGTKADTAWTGSGSGSIVAILKSLYLPPGQSTKSGSIPVTIASDQGALAQGAQNSSGLSGQISCDSSAVYDTNTNGKTQLVALSSGKVIYVCGYSFAATSSSAVTVSLSSGTGTNCGTTSTNITPGYVLQSAASQGPAGIVDGSPYFRGLKTSASNELCIVTNAAVSVQAIVYYSQF